MRMRDYFDNSNWNFVRFILKKDDYDKLVKQFSKQFPDSDLFTRTYARQYKLFENLVYFDKCHRPKYADAVYFGWDGIYWLTKNEYTCFIMNFIVTKCDYYAYSKHDEFNNLEHEEKGFTKIPVIFNFAFDSQEEK